MQRHVRIGARIRSPNASARENPQPFLQTIMEEPIPSYLIMLKLTPFSRLEDPENHLKAF